VIRIKFTEAEIFERPDFHRTLNRLCYDPQHETFIFNNLHSTHLSH